MHRFVSGMALVLTVSLHGQQHLAVERFVSGVALVLTVSLHGQQHLAVKRFVSGVALVLSSCLGDWAFLFQFEYKNRAYKG